MDGENKERWVELCELIANNREQDPATLIRLVEEVNRLLLEKEERLAKARLPPEI